MNNLVLFEEQQVRRVWVEADQKWYFSVVDVVGILTSSVNAGAYWQKLKERLKKEGNETVTDCHAFKITAADGKQRLKASSDCGIKAKNNGRVSEGTVKIAYSNASILE